MNDFTYDQLTTLNRISKFLGITIEEVNNLNQFDLLSKLVDKGIRFKHLYEECEDTIEEIRHIVQEER